MNRPLVVFFGLLTASSVATGEAADDLAGLRPNIILVMTDDQGYGPIGRHGNPWIETPNLDALYDLSTRFTRFLVSPTCSPTRSALMTGRHPMRNGVTHTIFERERLTLDAVTLPDVLKTAGYRTAIFGKWHLGDEEPYQPQHRGFDETFIHGAGGIGQAYECSCADVPNNTYNDPIFRHNGTFEQTQGFCTDVFFDAALAWIADQKDADAPFFAYIATNAPHAPFIAPPENTDRLGALGFDENAAGFYGMIENIDENMGRLLALMQDEGLFDDTVLIFMSDNGMSGGIGAPGSVIGHDPDGTPLRSFNAGMKGIKGSVDEGGVRVPFFIRWDGRIAPDRDVDRVAAHIDLLPTLAALAGAALPEGQVEGRSLLPLLEDPEAPWDDRFLVSHQGRWAPGTPPEPDKWVHYAVRNQRFRLVEGTALFDMEVDPGQTTNVIAEQPDLVRAMTAYYDDWWDRTRPLMVNEGVPPSPVRPFFERFELQKATIGIPDWEPPDDL